MDCNIRVISIALKKRYGSPRLGNKSNPLDELIYIVLSGASIEKNYSSAYLNLKGKYRKWEDLANARIRDIYRLIKHAGLGHKKAKIIKGIVRQLRLTKGRVSLRYLKYLSQEDAINDLLSFPGVDLKSAKCVLMYSLYRPVFPIDTHASRILRRIGFLDPNLSFMKANTRLESLIPNSIKYDLHVNLIALGRDACSVVSPDCHHCCINDYCHYGKA